MTLSAKLTEFIQSNQRKTPYLVVDLEQIKEHYHNLMSNLSHVTCYYSVKSNPAPEILNTLHSIGSKFEGASIQEIQLCVKQGIPPENIHFGNTIKKAEDIATAFKLGVRSYAFDCEQELEKLIKHAPESHLVCRLKTDGKGARWGLCKKFGCSVERAIALLTHASENNMVAAGVSFHVGSQQQSAQAWNRALKNTLHVFEALEEKGITPYLINIGGGFPASGYVDEMQQGQHIDMTQFASEIRGCIETLFLSRDGEYSFMCEPGRYLLSEAGCIKSQVILTTYRQGDPERLKWVYLDIGKFNGLYEATDIKHPAYLLRESTANKVPTVLAGPTCDSDDMLTYRQEFHNLPVDTDQDDYIYFPNTGAYSNSYVSVGFNGIPPLDEYYLE
jgi:ornithine decarboxylase